MYCPALDYLVYFSQLPCFYPHFADMETEISQLVSGRVTALTQICPTHNPRSPPHPSSASLARGYDAVNLGQEAGVTF